MSYSSVAARSAKPSKPYDKFPLTIHPSGRYCKKIRGKVYYFGSWAGGWQAALAEYERQRDYLHAGVKPPATDGLTVKAACNEFLNAKRALVDSGELSLRSWHDYRNTCERVSKAFGPGRMVENLTPEDFANLRAEFTNGKRKGSRGPVCLSGDVQRARTLFKWCYDMGLIATPVRFGAVFKKPSRKVLRKLRQQKGSRAFTADEIRKLLANASPAMRAMILLGINAAMGQADLASLPRTAIDFERGWITFPRPKTGAERRCPLWKSTERALREWLSRCPAAKDPADADLVFVTRCGTPWCKLNPVSGATDDAISKEFAKLLRKLGIKRHGLNFYALRRTFRTVADETLDQPATRLIMGHLDSAIDDHYREHVADARLVKVAGYVLEWLYPSPLVRSGEVSNSVGVNAAI